MKERVYQTKYQVDGYHCKGDDHRQKLHDHEWGEVLFFTEGKGFFHTEQKDYPSEPGTAIVVPPETKHCSFSEEPFMLINVIDRNQKYIMIENPLILKDNEEGDGRALAEMLFRYRHVNSPFITELIGAYFRFWMQRAELPGATETALNEVYQKLLKHAHDKELDLHAVPTDGGYAEDYMRMLFKRRYGIPPLKFLMGIRMEMACSLLETYRDIPLTEVAARCGYDDYVYFSKTFKTHTGQSPRQYLKNLQ